MGGADAYGEAGSAHGGSHGVASGADASRHTKGRSLSPFKSSRGARSSNANFGGYGGGGEGPPPSMPAGWGARFPLYIDHAGVERERTRFAYAVFLLNKNIEQVLNAHGLEAYGIGPHYTLLNLSKFLSYC